MKRIALTILALFLYGCSTTENIKTQVDLDLRPYESVFIPPSYLFTPPKGKQATAPRVIRITDPIYPAELAKTKMTGFAVVSFVIEPDGTPSHIVAIEATNKYFAQAAEQTISQWRYKPATWNGVAVAVKGRQPINF